MTSIYKEMLLLEHISEYKETTQSIIANVIGASLSMTNNYIDQLEADGLLTRNYLSAKTVNYDITPLGINRMKYLQITYIKELMDYYVTAQKSAQSFLEAIENKQFKKILLYGAGEVAEIIIDIINTNDFTLKVVGIIDDDINKQNKKLKDIEIYSNKEINKIDHDGIIITSYAYESDILNKLADINYPKSKVIRYFEMKG